MTNINGIPKMVVGSKDYELIQKMMGEKEGSKINDEETLFKTMQYYEMTNCSDNWSSDAQNLSIEELIKLWQEFDQEDTSFAADFDTFDAYLANYTKDEPDVPGTNPDPIRPYEPNPGLTDDQKERLKDFDEMRANDVHAKLDQEGDYELLLEYIRQREGSTLLPESHYDIGGSLNNEGKAKEAEMIAKLQELDTEDNTLGTVMEEFLNFFGIKEVSGSATNQLGDAKEVINDITSGSKKEVNIGGNKYMITNNGADGNELTYEVKTNEKGEKYIAMVGNDWRIQDISGELQADYIQMTGSRNELDMAMGDDIVHLFGDDNRALMGNGNDKVYIQGNNNFTDLWRGDDEMFNIDSNNTTGLGFTGDDNFYVKGDNVTVNGESNTEVGDGLYEDGIITDYDIENTLTKPEWFPEDEPVPSDKNETSEDGIIEFNGIKYEVYKKFGTEATNSIVYYKAEDGRTVFEADGWNITVIGSMNDTGDKNYANVVIQGNRNSYFGSNDQDIIEIRGDKNNVHGDTSDTMGSDDKIYINSGTGNYIYGEAGIDEVNTDVEGNFFNKAIIDIESVNNTPVENKPQEPTSSWVAVTEPTEQQTAQIDFVKDAFGLSADSEIKGLKQNGSFLGMTIDGVAYVAQTNEDGTTKAITQKSSTETLSKIEFTYNNGEVDKTTTTDYKANSKTVENADGSKVVTVYDDVAAKNPKIISQTTYDKDGNVISDSDSDVGNNTITEIDEEGNKTDTIYDDITSDNRKPISQVKTDSAGNVIYNKEYNYDENFTITTNADGTSLISRFTNLEKGEYTIQSTEYYDEDGNLTNTETYKNGEVDMNFVEGNIMSVDDFFKAADTDKDGEIKQEEIIKLYNETKDPVLKALLSNFTDGTDVTFAFKVAATTTGSKDFNQGNQGITINTRDINMIAENGQITSSKLTQLQTNAAYAELVGYELNNAWDVYLNDDDGTMTTLHPAYALTDNDGVNYHQYTMGLLNAAGGNSINRADLAKFGITTTEDFKNKELFNKLREASDLVEEIDKLDNNVVTNDFGATLNLTGSITAQNVLDMYNSCVSGENKDKDFAEKMKKLCLESGLIVVENDVARLADGTNEQTKVKARDLYKVALAAVEYPNKLDF